MRQGQLVIRFSIINVIIVILVDLANAHKMVVESELSELSCIFTGTE